MISIRDEIYKIAKGIYVEVECVNENTKNEIMLFISNKYLKKAPLANCIFEDLNDFECLSKEINWSCIEKFLEKKECVLFFNNNDEEKIFAFKCGKELLRVVGESYLINEFYITDKMGTFLIGYSHHDIWYGCGSAKKFIKSLKYNK